MCVCVCVSECVCVFVYVCVWTSHYEKNVDVGVEGNEHVSVCVLLCHNHNKNRRQCTSQPPCTWSHSLQIITLSASNNNLTRQHVLVQLSSIVITRKGESYGMQRTVWRGKSHSPCSSKGSYSLWGRLRGHRLWLLLRGRW